MRVTASILALAATTGAQALSVTNLVQGQAAALDVTGAAPSNAVVYGLSFNGIGSGLCLPGTSLCLDVPNPVYVLGLGLADLNGDASLGVQVPAGAPLIPIGFQAITTNGAFYSKTNAVLATIDTLASYTDTFAGTSLDPSWSVLNGGLASISVSGGELHLQPVQGGPSATWFADAEGVLVYKAVTGDFDVTANMRVEDPTSPGSPPPTQFRFAGLLARDPASVPGNRNSVHVVMGAGPLSTPLAAEDKSTTASSSNFLYYGITQATGQVRLRRLGATFHFYHRPNVLAGWTLLRAHQRNDLPATLQVGPMVYSYETPPDIVAHFADVTFAP